MPDGTVYLHQGMAALFHVFRVAAGLDSLVLGETEILGQMRESLQIANEIGAVGKRLHNLVEHALLSGKRVRQQTRLGLGTLSVARAAVDLARKVRGDLSKSRVLLVGTGETGLLVARHLREHDPAQMTFTNRTFHRAEDAAKEFSGIAVPLDQLAAAVRNADLTIVSVTAKEPVLRPEHVKDVNFGQRGAMPLFIDLSVPRGIDPLLRQNGNILLQDLDDLCAVVDQHRVAREGEVESVERILVEEVHKFLALQTYARIQPVIHRMHSDFERIQEEMRAGGEVKTPEMEAFMQRLCRRLLAESLKSLKLGTREAFSPDQLEHSYRRYLEDLWTP
jgi:glutamyl-tRNA reductase